MGDQTDSTREQAQNEVREIIENHVRTDRYTTYEKDEAADMLGKAWSDISTTVPCHTERISDLQEAIKDLEDKDYTVSIKTDRHNRIAVEVKITVDVIERLEGGLEV